MKLLSSFMVFGSRTAILDKCKTVNESYQEKQILGGGTFLSPSVSEAILQRRLYRIHMVGDIKEEKQHKQTDGQTDRQSHTLYTHLPRHACGTQRTTYRRGLVFFFYRVGLGHQTLIIGVGGKHIYHLRRVSGPLSIFYKTSILYY